MKWILLIPRVIAVPISEYSMIIEDGEAYMCPTKLIESCTK